MPGISCVDCVGPAFSLMKTRLFQPFRFGFWSRIAVLGVLAGELSFNSGGSKTGHSGGTTTYRIPHSLPHGQASAWIAQHWHAILGVVGAAFLIGLLFFFISSVLRFVLYEAVLRDKARILEGFHRWSEQGFEYFLFRLTMVIPYVAIALYLVGWPLFKVLQSGGGGPEMFAAMAQLVGAALFVGLLGVLLATVMVLTKDFVVPQMIFEQVTCIEGWGRLWIRIRNEPGSFVGYILLKIALSIGALIAFAIAMVITMLILAIPVGVMIAAGVVVFKVVGGGFLAIASTALLAVVIAAPLFIYCVGFVGAPISVFFPAYSIYYFASRYKPLYDELYPQAPPSQPL